jgi:DNA-binding PadR family transcriptional regulator
MHAEVLKGHLDLLLLAVLAHGAAHGYGLVEALRQRSDGAFDLGEGTMYPALYRLERERLVTSRWRVVDGRRRRVYRLTPKGERRLRRQRGQWSEFVGAVEAVLA